MILSLICSLGLCNKSATKENTNTGKTSLKSFKTEILFKLKHTTVSVEESYLPLSVN